MNNIKNRLKGALYGFAIGDAMGATTEFMSEAEIKRDYGKLIDIVVYRIIINCYKLHWF